MSTSHSDNVYDADIERALRASEVAHRGQTRKGTEIPYVVHPIHVAIELARLDVDPILIQAALLHDVVEDCKNAGWDGDRVGREFGPVVAGIVAELTEDKGLTWEERKLAGIAHVAHMSDDARTVKAADKLHNLRSLATDLAAASDKSAVWVRFTGGKEKTLELSGALVEALAAHVDPRLGRALRAAMSDVKSAG